MTVRSSAAGAPDVWGPRPLGTPPVMQMQIEPAVGAPAPGFRAPTSHGQTLDSESFHGKLAVVLFFLAHPGRPDDELLLDSFDEHLVDFGHERVQLLGVAPSAPRELRERADGQQLAVTILADESGAIARSFGVAAAVDSAVGVSDVADTEAGDAGLAPPATVIIDHEGIIAARVPRTDTAHHVEQVLETLRVSLRPRTGRSSQ
jgi:peroxiredoxin